jgi:hypothetical protein
MNQIKSVLPSSLIYIVKRQAIVEAVRTCPDLLTGIFADPLQLSNYFDAFNFPISCWWKRPRSRCAACPSGAAKYHHLMMRRGGKTAKVAMARRLAVRHFWMRRQEWNCEQFVSFGSQAGQPGNRHGVQ